MKQDNKIIIAGGSHPQLARALAQAMDCELLMANTQKFANQELKIQINCGLYDKEVILLQSISHPANDHLMELLLLADTAKRAGCRHIIAVVPYLGYSRQDKSAYDYGPISASLVARLIQTSGIDRLITIDIHSKQLEGFFKIGVKTIDAHDLFIAEYNQNKNSNKNNIIISPDIGGLSRARILADKLGSGLALINKSRNRDGLCTSSDVIGDVRGKHCIIIDDIIDTGDTLCNAARLLKEKGAHSISACITHAVLCANNIESSLNNSLEKIESVGFAKFLISDTIPHQSYPSFIKVLPTSTLLAQAL